MFSITFFIKIFDHLEHTDFRALIQELSDMQIRFYMYELMKV